jgi:hypothetical protein
MSSGSAGACAAEESCRHVPYRAFLTHTQRSCTNTNLIDFFVVRRGHCAITDLFSPRGIYGAWNWRGLTAYAIGFVAEIPFMVLPDIDGWHYTGPLAKQISDVDIAWIVGLIVTSVAYLLLSRSIDLRHEQPAIEASETQLAAETPERELATVVT